MANTLTPAFIKVENILQQSGLQPGMRVADFGCGAGHFALRAAQLTGSRGQVYAVDVQRSLLEQIKREAKLRNLSNLEVVWSDIETVGATRIAPDSLDMALIVNTLFQTANQANVLLEARRLLKSGGSLVVVEWKAGNHSFGPGAEGRLSFNDIEKMAVKAGFVKQAKIDAGAYHYAIVLFRP